MKFDLSNYEVLLPPYPEDRCLATFFAFVIMLAARKEYSQLPTDIQSDLNELKGGAFR